MADELDALPRDSSEFLDTDFDGIGNNADTDDDGDRMMILRPFPLGRSGVAGHGWRCLGDNADPDDDGDGVGIALMPSRWIPLSF